VRELCMHLTPPHDARAVTVGTVIIGASR
jgi:hypothetical protein